MIYSFGDIFALPDHAKDLEDMELSYIVVCIDPNESIREIGKYILCGVMKGRAKRSCQIQCDKEFYIDCYRVLRLSDDQLGRCKHVGFVEHEIQEQLLRYDFE